MAELGQTTHGGPWSDAGKAGNIEDREDRLLPWRSVRDITGISRTTAWRMQQTGDFPHPVPVSAKRVGWWESELTAWKARRRFASGERPTLCIQGKPSGTSAQKSQVTPAKASIPQTEVSSPAVSSTGKAPMRGRTRTKAVSPDQIDFGF